MVGVAGKYKGCNTCRLRRVKCDNRRPTCRKCADSGRKCAGYIRETVFVVGTTKDRGRVSSHPYRSQKAAKEVKSKSGCPVSKSPEPSSVANTDVEGHEDAVTTAENADEKEVRCVALHARLEALEPIYHEEWDSFKLPTLAHCLPAPSSANPALDMSFQAVCLIPAEPISQHKHLMQESSSPAGQIRSTAPDICLFLYDYEQISSMVGDPGPWKEVFRGSPQIMKERGPEAFKTGPSHHVFMHVFRTLIIFRALTQRKATFLADPEWCTVPWETLPKTPLDYLLDIIVRLPSLFERSERLHSHPPSFARMLKAKDLFANCMAIDAQLTTWYRQLYESSSDDEPILRTRTNLATDRPYTGTYYAADSRFLEVFEFKTAEITILHLYYWSALCLFYRIIQEIHPCISPPPSPPLPILSLFSLPAPFPHPFYQYQYPDPSSNFNEGSYAPDYLWTLPAQAVPQNDPADPEPLDEKFSSAAVENLAVSICKALEYVLRESSNSGPASTFGPDVCVFPLLVVKQVLGIDDVIERQVGENGGFGGWVAGFENKLGEARVAFAQSMGQMVWKEDISRISVELRTLQLHLHTTQGSRS